YRVLDGTGNKVGVPIKASSISCNPTLGNLEKKFTTNETAKESLKPFVKVKLDECLAQSPTTMKDLIEKLKQKSIYTVLRQNAEGRLYGITFVDNQNKVVFNGSDLGKGYSVAALQSGLASANEKSLTQDETNGGSSGSSIQKEISFQKQQEKTIPANAKTESFLDVLLTAKEQFGNTPYSLLQKKRKKKRKNPNS
ncbi:MAG: hypothetical protein KGZ74_05780, partial [Chitinophagaceae bacterium]|nr:hypothetical protein [Chitinophagaceae bacterium]